MLPTFSEKDRSNIVGMRTSTRILYEEAGPQAGLHVSFCQSIGICTEQLPVVNATMDDMEIVYSDFGDISVAVATPKGLMVPIINQSNSYSANIPGEARLSGVTAESVFNSKICEKVPWHQQAVGCAGV